jgi:hypothetical protein
VDQPDTFLDCRGDIRRQLPVLRFAGCQMEVVLRARAPGESP